eukprot:7876763-Pyramimonas_sp.AAC.1
MAFASSDKLWPRGRRGEQFGHYRMTEGRGTRAKRELGREQDQGGRGSQWKSVRLNCESVLRPAEWPEWGDEEKLRHGGGKCVAREQVSRDQKQRARCLAWTVQPMGRQRRSSTCGSKATSRGGPAIRNKEVLERPREASKALVEGIKKRGGIFAAFSRAVGNWR